MLKTQALLYIKIDSLAVMVAIRCLYMAIYSCQPLKMLASLVLTNVEVYCSWSFRYAGSKGGLELSGSADIVDIVQGLPGAADLGQQTQRQMNI